FPGPFLPFLGVAREKYPLQFRARIFLPEGGDEAEFFGQAADEYRFQGRHRDPSITGLIESVKGEAAAESAARCGKSRCQGQSKVTDGVEERDLGAPDMAGPGFVEQKGQRCAYSP